MPPWLLEYLVFRTQPDRRNDPRWRRIIRAISFLLLCASVLLLEGTGYSARSTHAAAWPDPLVLQSGAAVHNRDDFEQQRRPEILRLFDENVYGIMNLRVSSQRSYERPPNIACLQTCHCKA